MREWFSPDKDSKHFAVYLNMKKAVEDSKEQVL